MNKELSWEDQKEIEEEMKNTSSWFCDCSESEIRRVDDKHPHASGIRGPGWFCMGCLTEFVKANAKGDAPR